MTGDEIKAKVSHHAERAREIADAEAHGVSRSAPALFNALTHLVAIGATVIEKLVEEENW